MMVASAAAAAVAAEQTPLTMDLLAAVVAAVSVDQILMAVVVAVAVAVVDRIPMAAAVAGARIHHCFQIPTLMAVVGQTIHRHLHCQILTWCFPILCDGGLEQLLFAVNMFCGVITLERYNVILVVYRGRNHTVNRSVPMH